MSRTRVANGMLASYPWQTADITNGTIDTVDLKDSSVTSPKIADSTIVAGDMAAGAAAGNVGTLGGVLGGTLPNPTMAANAVGTTQIANGAVTTDKILDGTIATADLADRSVTNAKLASDTARANLLTNGGLEVWQRGNGPFAGTGGLAADGWRVLQLSGTMSTARDTANAERGSCIAVTTTGTDSLLYQSFISGTEGHDLRGRMFSMSVRIRCNVANVVRPVIMDASGVTSYGTYHSGSGTYETLTVTTTAVVSTAATNVQARISFGAASTYYVDSAMLVVGTVAADYAPLHPADAMVRCQRYYEIVGKTNPSILLTAYNTAGAGSEFSFAYATKAVAPTATSLGTWSTSNCGPPVLAASGEDAFSVRVTATATGNAAVGNYNAGACFVFEANP